ncbi:hypothetical protein GALMADRAFT_142272 [Galerina marginata CBS 339.88]|uniref:Citrate transporter-like domain-containing protein n=1 Tax=Galerina marginata (strain CBS 339.88) TaxID=685588 RepID=A0A067T275_GALM3|nr:hypothetical protein GALMADRAFT_142272 [Galerina marginata CBS 339.88]
MVSGPAIATLVVFILSIICVIHSFSFTVPLPLPYLGLRRTRIHLNLTTAPIIAILVLWAAQCLGPRDIRDGIVGTDGVKPYNILILFFTLAYMAITLDITGVLQAAAFWVSNKGGSNGRRLFLYFYMMLTVLSVVLGNDPVILSGTAFLVYYTKANELNPIAWLISEFAAANTASMVLFVGNPTNVVICEGFSVNNAAFTAYTILPFLACSLTCYFVLFAQFHNAKYVPKKLNVATDLDPRSVLLDPTGAWVGSVLLLTCLVVIIVVSFFHVDVWKISLPFAVAKFAYDLGWDHYRSVKGIDFNGGLRRRKEKDINEDLSNVEDDIVRRELAQHNGQSHVHAVKPEDHFASANGNEDEGVSPPRAVTFDEPKHGLEPAEPGMQSIPSLVSSPSETRNNTRSNTANTTTTLSPALESTTAAPPSSPLPFLSNARLVYNSYKHRFQSHFPTLATAFPRLPFALIPFAFSQFILIQALASQGWITIFARWLVIMTGRQIYPTIWVVGVLGVLLCNMSGTNIGATILLTKVVRAATVSAAQDPNVTANLEAFNRSAAIALAVASNIGAVSFTFSASLAGLLWKQILLQKGIKVRQVTFARWNLAPVVVMTAVGLGVVCAEMAVLF